MERPPALEPGRLAAVAVSATKRLMTMPPRPRALRSRLDWPIMVALYGAALAARWPLVDVSPYGDEPLHYWVASHFQAHPRITDIFGNSWVHPDHIFWQRPAFYVGYHAFALAGFEGLRVGHILVASLLPPVVYGLLRSHGVTRPFASAGGLVTAVFPLLVAWGALAVMDSTMTLLFVCGLWARRAGRPTLAAVLFLLSVWTKETAFFALAALAAASVVRDWVTGRMRLDRELVVPKDTALLLVACSLALVPLFVAMSQGLQMPGAHAAGYGDRLVDELFVSPWLLPVLVLGLAWPRSRPLAGIALFVSCFTLAYHVIVHRAVEVWYLVMPVTLCIVALAATLDEWWRRTASGRPATRAGAGLAVVVVGLLLVTMVVAQPSPTKGLATHPITRHADESLLGTYRYERDVRDGWRDQAFEALALDGTQEVVFVDLDYPQALQVVEDARHVYVDSAWFRSIFDFEMDGFARIVETNGTRLLVRQTDYPFYHAINEAYGDCRVFENALYRLYHAWECPGGLAKLEQGVHSRSPP